MADFNIKGTVKLDDKGSLKRTGKNAKDTARSFDDLSKSQNAYNKREKGVAGATANSTKAFSKMTTGIRTGLVPAYAILAANIFALTAAFNGLRRAAQIDDLARGLQFVGNVAGRDLGAAAARIREVTGAAVSLGDAMRTTAVGISAGFRTDQLEGLARVAKGAAIALGRDMGDALDRLTRGVAKLEPEILDELGILVRIDEAAQKYADTLNVNVNSLSRFQRQQAFLNETITQGEKKYGDLADELDPNAFDKLSAAAQDLAKSFVDLLNTGNFLIGTVDRLSQNQFALASSTLLLAGSIGRQLVPGLFNAGERAEAATNAYKEMASQTAKNLKIGNNLGKVTKELSGKIADGTATTEEFAHAQTVLSRNIAQNEKWEKTYADRLKTGDGAKEDNLKKIEKTRARLVDQRKALKDLNKKTK